jgi:hypothetical protein
VRTDGKRKVAADMTRTPDEIKKGLACCAASIYQCADDCPYRAECRNGQGGKVMNEEALALIQKLQKDKADLLEERELNDFLRDRVKQLEAEKTKLLEESHEVRKDMLGRIHQLEAERDAALEDLESYATLKCFACKYYEEELTEVPCNECKILGKGNRDMFEWRGVQKD